LLKKRKKKKDNMNSENKIKPTKFNSVTLLLSTLLPVNIRKKKLLIHGTFKYITKIKKAVSTLI